MENLYNHHFHISKRSRQELHGHNSFVLWFTGLSGSGKSTIANLVEKKLHVSGHSTYILDGDNIRKGINNNLDFTEEDRKENVRRVAEISKLFVDAGIIVLTSVISPFQADRESARKKVENNEFIEIYIKCPIEECEKRDPKGLYKKARSGLINGFTGINSPYEEPLNPELTINSMKRTPEECAEVIINYLKDNQYIRL
ncbi:adenylyl-sulfate kinase [Metabacillus malikii]|uniref:Adenylyl-sulfate kinase n=1 Tax=Metabacillus malikii TaxID=1504265 RepID=A0ABT9ZMR9_9BACI|nr:adenylyl-sulfate kinase [Metabacillus malikii]MDQ0232505.1 adenylylsulfate kinase [Metabacillus malikii]